MTQTLVRSWLLLALVTSAALTIPVSTAVAQREIQLARDADPLDWEAWFDAGVELLKKNPTLALQAFERASAMDPSRAEPLFARSVAFWMTQRGEDWIAYRDGNAFQLRRPEVRRADSLYSLALQRNPFVHRGLEIALVDRFPGDWGRRADTRAWIAYSAGNFAEAVRWYTQWVEGRREERIWSVWRLAVAKVGANDLSGARADLMWIIEELRRREQEADELPYYYSKEFLWHSVGLIDVQLRDLANARVSFGEATIENAGFAYAHAALGAVERTERKFPAAIAAYAQAVELAPTDPALRQQYAQILLDANRYDAAIAEALRATELAPDWAAPHYVIGRARERQGRMTEARAAYARYVNMSPAADAQARTLRQRFPGD